MRDGYAREAAPPGPAPMAQALLAEIADHLARLFETGEAAAIDLRSLPLSPADHAALDAALGEGEVRATVQAGGRSEIAETRYPGVWRVEHRAAGGETLLAQILVTPVPDLLRADPADIADGAERLRAALAQPEGDDDAEA